MGDAGVIVVGGGNAAMCAALAALEKGASVLVLERANEDERGGNTRFTAGAMRVAYDGLDDLLQIMPDLSEDERANTDFGSYPADQFFDDMARVTEYRANPDLVEVLVRQSQPTLVWMREQGIRFMPMYGRQAFKIDGRFRFWGGLTVEAWGGGAGLCEAEFRAVEKAGAEIRYGARVISLVQDGPRVCGVVLRQGGYEETLHAKAVVLACGGFEANAEWRTRYLGPGWDLAKVRGSRFNTGDGIRMALDAGAVAAGNWSGCHAVGWDRNAPPFGDLAVGDGFQKHSYPFGIMVNGEGKRFVDEGADFRNYTYAKYGRRVLQQPGQFAWQIFDAKVEHLLRDEYHIREVTKVTADTLENLAARLDDVDTQAFLETIAAFNTAVRDDIAFDPTVKDGRCTEGLTLAKSNWANALDTPPYSAYAITCGVTFTFGGIAITPDCAVAETDGGTIPGLFAAGELVGDLFYFNYPGGTGLTSGSVFGRIAGGGAADFAKGNG